jgi:ABC-type protease/lipase transport system fused ATPase/permease subunit
MKNGPSSRWSLLAVVSAVLLVIAVSATSQTQQRVQSTTQLTVAQPVVANPLSEWEAQYAEAMKMVAEIAEAGSPEQAERFENDLEALDQALRAYVRVSERLRHKNRAMAETMDSLLVEPSTRNMTQLGSMKTNITQAVHDVHKSIINNLRG